MHILNVKNAGWVRQVRSWFHQHRHHATRCDLRNKQQPLKGGTDKELKETLSALSCVEDDASSKLQMQNTGPARRDLCAVQCLATRKKQKRQIKAATDLPIPFSHVSPFSLCGNGQDLRRFLEEVGTDPKEARYWLYQFQQSTEPLSPFAVVQVNTEVFEDQNMLDSLGSCLAFLQRNNMKCIVIHGVNTPQVGELPLDMHVTQRDLCNDSMMLVSVLESHGVMARPFFSGNGIFCAQDSSDNHIGQLESIDTHPIQWAMHTGHIPVLQSVGETDTHHTVLMDVCQVTSELAKVLQPRKVLFINTSGGFIDDKGEPIPNVNLPHNWLITPEEICLSDYASNRVCLIDDMLSHLPRHSSVVITSATTLLTELFTHHGSGTFFKITEPIHSYSSLKHVNKERLALLLNRSFGKDLSSHYFEELETKIHTLYVSEDYNAAAIITREEGCNVPYLDKFAVGQAQQGEGMGEMLWNCIERDFSELFWRSRITNKINPWYFKRCGGLWSSSSEWMVFWYGVTSHKLTSGLIDFAFGMPSSFEEVERKQLIAGSNSENHDVGYVSS